jgi:hypothetical protein
MLDSTSMGSLSCTAFPQVSYLQPTIAAPCFDDGGALGSVALAREDASGPCSVVALASDSSLIDSYSPALALSPKLSRCKSSDLQAEPETTVEAVPGAYSLDESQIQEAPVG